MAAGAGVKAKTRAKAKAKAKVKAKVKARAKAKVKARTKASQLMPKSMILKQPGPVGSSCLFIAVFVRYSPIGRKS